MNDFTKEELEQIRAYICYEGYDIDDADNEYLPLLNKVQAMIDNHGKKYCSSCNALREGNLLDDFYNNGHWSPGGMFCGQWI